MSLTTAALPRGRTFLTPQRAMFVLICFVWGTTWLGMKVGIAVVPPGVFAGLRWSVAGLVLLLIRHWRGELIRPPPRLWFRLLGVSVLLITLNQVIQLYGLKYITAGLAAVISSALTPIALLGFSVALGQERFNLRQLGAIGLGVLGVCTLFGPAALAALQGMPLDDELTTRTPAISAFKPPSAEVVTLNTFIDNQPDDVAQLLRSWLNDEREVSA